MLANLRALFGVVVDIVLLRRGPEHLPASTGLLGVVIAINLIVSAVLTQMMPKVPPNWVLQLVVGNLLVLVWFQAGLSLAQKRERFVQTVTAIFIVSTLFLPILVPLFAAMQPYMADPENVPPPPGFVVLAAVAFAVWLLVIEARIVRSAFEWPTFLSIVFILAQNFVSAWLLGLLFATPGTPA
jgi:hypothetical protein